MIAQPPSEFLTPDFIAAAANELAKCGFISDEHDFAPYRETIATHVTDIEAALREAGHDFRLVAGFLKHPQAGFAYYIFDTNKLGEDTAKKAVTNWLNQRYQ